MSVYMFMEHMKSVKHRLQHKLLYIDLKFPEYFWGQVGRLKILRTKTERFEFEAENQSER